MIIKKLEYRVFSKIKIGQMASILQALLPAWNFSSLKKCHPTAADAFIKKSNWSVLLKF